MARPHESPESVLFDAARAWVSRVYGPGHRPVKVSLVLDTGEKVQLPVPVPWARAGAAGAARPADGEAAPRHSADFRSVNWFGAQHTFTALQAAIVRQLWAAWEAGTPDVGQDTLLEAAGAEESSRVVDLFRGHEAWGSMIASRRKGTLRLVAREELDPGA